MHGLGHKRFRECAASYAGSGTRNHVVHGRAGHLRCGCRELSPYLSLSEVHQGLLSAALLGVEQPAKLGALHHPIEQMVRVGACAGGGSQVLAAKRLDRSYERQKGPVRLRPGAR